MAIVRLENVHKSFGSTPILHGIDLEVRDGEFAVFVGPSGCGKSTLLRLIAGLEDVSGGEIWIGDSRVTDLEPSARGVSMVFQSYALYPHMTVYKNIAFGLSLTGAGRERIDDQVRSVAKMLQIDALLDRRPRELSGGQRQRVAIARAIVREPRVFLFDEPLSNLDAALRAQTRVEIARLHERLTATMIYVTHDQVEAMTLADRMVVLNRGRVEQVGTPAELYHRPANLFVAGFLGAPQMNIMPVAARDGAAWLASGERLPLAELGSSAATLGVRPEDLRLAAPGTEGALTGEVLLVEELGETRLVHVALREGVELVLRDRSEPAPSRGARVAVVPDLNRCHIFDRNGKRIDRTPASPLPAESVQVHTHT